MKKILSSSLIIGSLLLIPQTSFALTETATLLPVLKNIFKAGTDTLQAVKTSMNITASTNGFGINAQAMTNQVSNVASKWVPEPFQDNVKNVVGSCLQDLQGKLFKKIKWPSATICGHDIIADIKQDIDDQLKDINIKIIFTINGPSLVSPLYQSENTEYIRKVKQKMINDLNGVYNEGDFSNKGIQSALDAINNTSDAKQANKQEDAIQKVITWNSTLDNIDKISKNLEVLGVHFNPTIVSSAAHYLSNDSKLTDAIISETKRYNRQDLNLFKNFFEYKKVNQIYSHNHNNDIVDKNRILNVSKLSNYIVFDQGDKKYNITIPGAKGKDIKVNLIANKITTLDKVTNPSSSDLGFNRKFFRNNYKDNGSNVNSNNITNFNYLTQAVKIYKNINENFGDLIQDTSNNGMQFRSTAYLEGIMQLLMIQIAQDYQYGVSDLNIKTNNAAITHSLLKNISDKLRLLHYTDANLNSILANK